MYSEVNLFRELKRELGEVNIENAFKEGYKLLFRVGDKFYQEMHRRVPEGEQGPPGGRRPSIRLWGKRIHESFDAPTVRFDAREEAIYISVLFDHPSVDEDLGGDVLSWFEHGTKPHQIPATDTKVVFWWGKPLKWPHKSGLRPGVRASTKAKYWGGPHVRGRGHWAKPYGDFTEDSYKEIEGSEKKVVSEVYRRAITAPLKNSHLLRRVG